MTPEALKIRDFILNSGISEQAKNEILPLLGVIDTPGIKDRIMQILEVEGKTAELEESFLNMDIDNPQGNVQQPIPSDLPIPPSPSVAQPVQPVPPVVEPAPTIPNVETPVPQVPPQVDAEAENLAQLQAQMQKLRQAPTA